MFYCQLCNEELTDETLYLAHCELYHNVAEGNLSDSEIHPDILEFFDDGEEIIPNNRPSVIAYAPPRNQQPLEPLRETMNEEPDLTIELLAHAFERSMVRHYRIRNITSLELEVFLTNVKKLILDKLKIELNRLNFIKFGLLLDTTFNNIDGETSNRGFLSRNRSVMQTSNLDDVVDECLQEIVLKITEHEARGSGWSLLSVNDLDLRVHKRGYGDRGSSYIPLPKKIQSTKSCINIKNNDTECFRYSMLVKFLVNEGANNICIPNRRYQALNCRYNFNGLNYPVSLADIKRFERRNPGVSVNVYGLDSRNNVYPLKVVPRELLDHTDLLLLSDDKVSHYVFIRDFSKLIHKQLTKNKNGITVCKRCFCFKHISINRGGRSWLSEHLKLCGDHPAVKVVLPTGERSVLKFNKIHNQYRIPIVIYADFESSLIPTENVDPDAPANGKYQKHVPNSYCIIVKSTLSPDHLQYYSIPTEPILYRGEEAAKRFVDDLYDIADKVSTLYSYIVPMEKLTDLQELCHLVSDVCYLCEKEFTESNVKVRDHDHLTGAYRGAACNACNINFKLPNFVPVVLHNLSGYDAHFIIPELGRDKGRIDVLAVSTEKFISFSKSVKNIKLRFIDSLRFLPFSLSTLAGNLQRNDLVETRKLVPGDKIDLVLRKGVFPYDYIDSLERFEETSLPPPEMFYSKLNESPVDLEDYEHALKVWTELNISTLGEYNDLYVKLDVSLLSDVMEQFRNVCMTAYGLDCFYCFTAPGLAWQAMMKETKCELQLLTDIDMVLMIEDGVRGGLTSSVTRYVKANNKHLPDFNPNEESVYIGYFDSNNLYGLGMSQPLPFGGFSWENPNTIGDILNIPKYGDVGYILDFDFEYPEHLHDEHYDLPLLPRTEVPPGSKHPKLMTTVENKSNYIAHYWTVQQAIELGIIIVKVNRLLRFSQKCWLKPYIDSNTARRAAATSNFHKEFFKLMNNSIYGKCLENKRNHMNLKLVSDEKKLLKLVQKANFKTSIIINENLVAVCLNKTNVVMDRPLYIGMCVLDISKTHMYDFHYNKMVNFYGRHRIGISYMDTDGIIYHIKTLDLYEDLRTFPHRNDFDFSDYPSNHPTYDNGVNKKLLGKFKDETQGVPLKEVVALMSKMYALKLLTDISENNFTTTTKMDDEERGIIKKAKGIKKMYLMKKVRFEHYYSCLFNGTEYNATFNTIRSFNHNLYSLTITKKSLSAKDDKRVILQDNIHTLPYGHYSLK